MGTQREGGGMGELEKVCEKEGKREGRNRKKRRRGRLMWLIVLQLALML